MFEDKGWKRGRVKGAYVAGDLCELGQAILLCSLCKHGFDWKKHHYYSVSHYDQISAIGRCDLCKEQSNKLNLYLHDTVVGDGKAWTPRSTLRAIRRKAIRLR